MAFGSGLDDNDEAMSEINMTPLVDVMLVLLIIFIITVPVLTHSVKVDLPQASNTPNELKPETIAISVTAEGDIHWNDDVIAFAELESRLAQEAGKAEQAEIHLRGDKDVTYEHVIKVMAAVQRAGLEKLGFVTQPNE
ncbi:MULTISPECIES: ExbD/TolR family protein [unclassified Ketobacter]|uniref:ExbD/TolR family protein n=1 Tax=unclassified Ketobacter TaxID=2639109 RepID=UPI000F26629E|nr:MULTISPECIES: biopolymer transporter ExbD [unclassified Ketobacter]MCK5790909.1 biopolymer transporter ExbD [Ketobacter sp.]RLT89271.1 MAG: biopolymer transporter ExbD [Ketobacter sp. GenoA1]RLT95883.1 MAG: biopolymer transporter ExbD [Ketobacter sp.]